MPEGDNGHKKTIEEMAQERAYNGLIVRIGELQRQDGLIAEGMDKAKGHGLGVIQTMITAEQDDKNYRQILKRARWKNQEHRDKFVKAIAVCRMCGAHKALRTLLDMITADSAGDEGAWVKEAIEGLTHTTLTTQEKIARGKKRDDKSTSPIS